jgi:ribulose-phosphate 3-epimerase
MIAAPKAMIGPSLLASDLSNLSGESARVLSAGADFLHLDVMDGHFVPNLTFGAPVVASLRKSLNNASAIFDVHLMVTNPEAWVEDMAKAGADIFTFHVEVTSCGDDLTPLISEIKNKGMKVGLAIKPGTPASSVYPYLDLLDLVLVMTVEPGFGGQCFMNDMMEKVADLRQRCRSDMDIEVDGGLAAVTVGTAAKAGANMIVAGSSVFKSTDAAAAIAELRNGVEEHLPVQ